LNELISMVVLKKLKEVIETNTLSFSTVDKSNAPHTIYVLYAKVIDNNKILITDNYMKKTKENILFNNKISLTILIGGAGFELKGTAEYFSEGEMLNKIKSIPENKEDPCKGAVVISVETVVKMG